MVLSDEHKFLKVIRLVPALVVALVTLAIILIMVHYNRQDEQKSLEWLRADYTQQAKIRIKLEVDSVYRQLVYEKNLIETELKSQIKQRVYEAYAVMRNIYLNNQDKSESEQIKLITDALRDIRFNDGRGYYFIYRLDGTNVLLPHMPEMEGDALWDFQDSRSQYIIRDLVTIADKQGEGYHRWWFYKPQNLENDLEKIGFVKHFAPLNLMIGTGEYVLDFELDVQRRLRDRIAEINYGNSGFMFVLDKSGTFLVHQDPALQNINGFNLYDEVDNSFYIRKVMALARQGGGYVRYQAPYKPATVEEYDKISYVRQFDHWDWTIGTGVYISELESYLAGKELQIKTQSEAELIKLIIFSFLMASVMFALAAYLTGRVQRMYKKHLLRSPPPDRSGSEPRITVIKDPLTELSNRIQLSQEARARIGDAEESGRLVAVVLLGLDQFKQCNERFGHRAADQLLAHIGQKFFAILDRHDTVCRYGGDEFGFCFPELVKLDELFDKIDILQQVFVEPLEVAGSTVTLSGTIGVAIYPDDGLTAEELIGHADIALHRAKVSHRGGVLYYDLPPAC